MISNNKYKTKTLEENINKDKKFKRLSKEFDIPFIEIKNFFSNKQTNTDFIETNIMNQASFGNYNNQYI